MNYFYAACIAIIALFIVLILQKRNKKVSDYLLIAINISIALFMLSDVLVRKEINSLHVSLQNFIPLLLFGLVIQYIMQFTHSGREKPFYRNLVFLPAFAFLVIAIPDHFILDNYDTSAKIEDHFHTPSITYQFIFKGSQIFFIAMLIYMDRELKLFGRKLKGGYSTIDTISVKWLRHFTWIYLGSVVLTTVLFGLQNLGLIPLEIPQVFAIIYGVLILSVFYLNYEGIRHYTLNEVNNVNNQNEVVPSNAEEGSTPVSKFKNTTPLSEKEKALEQKMLDLIGEKKLYLETRFSLKDLASHLDESTHTISRIINSRDGRSFYDLINGYRVNHLKKMLDDPRNSQFTILSMGLESGFNSKATMNRIFKNTTGLSPKEYLQQKS